MRGTKRLQPILIAIATTIVLLTSTPLGAAPSGNGAAEQRTNEQTPACTEERPCDNGDTTRALVGLEQIGDADSDAVRKFYFDFFVSRPLPVGVDSGHRWWGDVRIGSTSVQSSAAISASSILGEAKKLSLNTIAQSADFQAGYEYRFAGGSYKSLDNRSQRAILGAVVGLGATLPLNPRSSLSGYTFPAKDTPGYQRLVGQYPAAAQYGDHPPSQIAFTTPERNSFFRQYFAGLRLTSIFTDQAETGPASKSVGTVTATVGQNEQVSGGMLRGMVLQIEGTYPLPFALAKGWNNSPFFLFGRAAIQLTGAVSTAPMLLDSADVAGASLTTVPVLVTRSRRDLYSIGIGVDAIKLARKIFGMDDSTQTAVAKTNQPAAPATAANTNQPAATTAANTNGGPK